VLQRLPRLKAPERTLEYLNGVVFVVTLLGGGLTAATDPPIGVVIIVGVILLLAYLYVALSRFCTVYDFVEGSPEFVKFFTNWYERQGNHIVFCDDLDWMENTTHASILAALEKQGARATVCLRECHGEAFERLRAAGVNMRQIGNGVTTRSKISIIEHDGLAQMIVRIATEADKRVRFTRTTDLFQIGVAHDLIVNSCPTISLSIVARN